MSAGNTPSWTVRRSPSCATATSARRPAYRDHGRIVARPTTRELRAALVDDWWEAARTGEHDAAMIAHRRSDVAELNAMAHARMRRDSLLGEE
jgi:hypothetical protein